MGDVHVGIDLAWSRRNPTGLAAVDPTGRVVNSAVALSDEDVLAWVAQVGSPVVVGIDAPIVVTNDTGRREAEQSVARTFGRFGAGPHSANRSMATFDPPRAWDLVQAAGWSLDLDAQDRPLAIEVFPHPAIVAWFDLPRRIAYKRGPQRRDELTRLVDLVETLPGLGLEDHARWPGIRHAVAEGRGRAVKDAEDEVDAILCARLAWAWHTRPDEMLVHGSVADGAIVTPRPPDGQTA